MSYLRELVDRRLFALSSSPSVWMKETTLFYIYHILRSRHHDFLRHLAIISEMQAYLRCSTGRCILRSSASRRETCLDTLTSIKLSMNLGTHCAPWYLLVQQRLTQFLSPKQQVVLALQHRSSYNGPGLIGRQPSSNKKPAGRNASILESWQKVRGDEVASEGGVLRVTIYVL